MGKELDCLVMEECRTTFETMGRMGTERKGKEMVNTLADNMAHAKLTIFSDALLTEEVVRSILELKRPLVFGSALKQIIEEDDVIKINNHMGVCTGQQLHHYVTKKRIFTKNENWNT